MILVFFTSFIIFGTLFFLLDTGVPGLFDTGAIGFLDTGVPWLCWHILLAISGYLKVDVFA
jgi:hypothetical protein